MEKANNDIREALKKSGVKQWELADKLGVANTRLCEKLRHELSGEEKCRIFNLIVEILEERKPKNLDDISADDMTETQLRLEVKKLRKLLTEKK